MTLLSFEQRDLSLDNFTNPLQRPQLLSDALEHDKNLDTLIAQLDSGGVLLTFVTDSSGDYVQFHPLFTEHLQPLIGALGYDDAYAEVLLGEVYVNAVIHGNKAGEVLDYLRRGLSVPERLDDNKKKHITIDYLLCSRFYVLRVTDEGEGFAEPLPQLNPQKLDPCRNDKTGRGLYIISRLSNSYYYTPPGNQITMVVYHPSAQPEVQAKEVHTTCTTL